MRSPEQLEAFSLPVEADGQKPLPFKLSGSQAKTAFALRANAEKMIREAGVNCVGFLTLTVGDFVEDLAGKRFDQVRDAAEASRRINNLTRRILADIFERAIVVTERHKSGAIHFHLLGVLRGRPDIRTRFNFEAVARRDYRSASDELRGIWAHLRAVLPRYGFGRAELMPVRKTGDAVAAYVAKYIEKNICNRLKEDKRKKLVRYHGWDKEQLKPNEFEWNGKRAVAWRAKARALFSVAGVELPDNPPPCEPRSFAGLREETRAMIRPKQLDGSQARERFGPRWAFVGTGIWCEVFKDDLLPWLEFTPGRYCRCLKELDKAEAWWQKQQVEGFRRWKQEEADTFHTGEGKAEDFWRGRIEEDAEYLATLPAKTEFHPPSVNASIDSRSIDSPHSGAIFRPKFGRWGSLN